MIRSRTLEWQDPVATAAAGAELSGIEYMGAIVAGEMPPPPIAVTMRLRPIEIGEGRVVFEGEPGEEHRWPSGIPHARLAAPDALRGASSSVGQMALPFGLPASYPRSVRHSPAARAGSRMATDPIGVASREVMALGRASGPLS